MNVAELEGLSQQLSFDDEHLIDVMRKAKESRPHEGASPGPQPSSASPALLTSPFARPRRGAVQLERVYNHAVRHCHHNISVQNAIPWFIQADEHKLDELREMSFKFIARNFRRIKAEAKETLMLLKDKPELMMEVMLVV